MSRKPTSDHLSSGRDGFHGLTLASVEPYLVLLTVLFGIGAFVGIGAFDIPWLVLLSGGVFLIVTREEARTISPRVIGGFTISYILGWVLYLALPANSGSREMVLACLAAGVPWALRKYLGMGGWPFLWKTRMEG